MKRTHHRSRNGFSRVELVVVLVIFTVLTALLLPSIQAAREAARRTSCANNLKMYGLGIHNYHDTFKVLPAGSAGFDAPPRVGWAVRVQPFFEASPFYCRLNFKLPNAGKQTVKIQYGSNNKLNWDNSKDPEEYWFNGRASEYQYPFAMCPNDPRDSIIDSWAQSSYSGSLGSQNTSPGSTVCSPFSIAGQHYSATNGNIPFGDTSVPDQVSGVFSRQLFGPSTLADISDGTSNTFAAGEILGDCHPNQKGWWYWNGAGNAHASTSVPLNTMTTCATSEKQALRNRWLLPDCFARSNTNLAWGFRSQHPGGANFLFVDGAVSFINNDIAYELYQQHGNRFDNLVPRE